ncbi:MAG TPA: MTH938/NDUFAF3 family protein [Steroidobacteraceae bacterium]|nr:MTH938/NDUFAF3 family protein [Steroidobacteraceae bacterium]
MKLTLDSDPAINTVRRYSATEVVIGARTLSAPCIVSASTLIADWTVSDVAGMTADQLAPLLALKPQIVLLGSAQGTRPAPAALRRACAARGIALETMDLGAACRTYNVLASESRPVVAGLIFRGAAASQEDTEIGKPALTDSPAQS